MVLLLFLINSCRIPIELSFDCDWRVSIEGTKIGTHLWLLSSLVLGIQVSELTRFDFVTLTVL